MTIQEAIKSGKRFRRPCWDVSVTSTEDELYEHIIKTMAHWEDPKNSLKNYFMADDWEIKETVEITRSQLFNIIALAKKGESCFSPLNLSSPMAQDLFREALDKAISDLGFKPL